MLYEKSLEIIVRAGVLICRNRLDSARTGCLVGLIFSARMRGLLDLFGDSYWRLNYGENHRNDVTSGTSDVCGDSTSHNSA